MSGTPALLDVTETPGTQSNVIYFNLVHRTYLYIRAATNDYFILINLTINRSI